MTITTMPLPTLEPYRPTHAATRRHRPVDGPDHQAVTGRVPAASGIVALAGALFVLAGARAADAAPLGQVLSFTRPRTSSTTR